MFVWESGCACAAVLYFMGHSKDAQTDALKCRKSHAIYTIFIYTTQIHELPLSLSLLPSLSLSPSYCMRLWHVIFVPASQMSAAYVHCLANKAKGPPQTGKKTVTIAVTTRIGKRDIIFLVHTHIHTQTGVKYWTL